MRLPPAAARVSAPLWAGVLCLLCLHGLGAFPLQKHAPRRVEVRIADLKFRPADTEVAPGDTVVWVNDDDSQHAVKADDGSFNSGPLASGHTFEHRFDKAGRVVYHDDMHPRMHGTVTVVDR